MSVLTADPTGRNTLFCKGAPESVIERCRYVLREDGKVEELTDEDRQDLEHKVNELAGEPLRTLAFAYKVNTCTPFVMLRPCSGSYGGSYMWASQRVLPFWIGLFCA